MAYVIGSGVPYGKYLQNQALIDSGTRRISTIMQRSTREIIASQEALHMNNIEVKQAVENGFEELSWEIQQVGDAITNLNATFEWGFNAIICNTGRMADTLESLLTAVKNQNKQRSYEYFNDAKIAFKRGHIIDALDLIEKAISGDHLISSGYKLEWRFHLLKGTIFIGSSAHPELIDLQAAEKSYQIAAEYAATDDPSGEALALLGESWACYCQNKLSDALTLCENALKVQPLFGEALFQTAKILMAINRHKDGFLKLEAALEEDPQYILKATSDGDFQVEGAGLEIWLRSYWQKKEKEFQNLYKTKSEDLGFWLRAYELQADLKQLGATLVKKDPGIFDLLCVLRTLRSISSNKASSSYNSLNAVNALRMISPQIKIPNRLLSELLDESCSWKLDVKFLEFTRILMKCGEFDALRRVILDRQNSEILPLEIFALQIEAFPDDLKAKDKLQKLLRRKSANSRSDLINEFVELRKSRNYSDKTIDTIRSIIEKQYIRWMPSIQKTLKKSAFSGSEHPLEGVIGRFFGSLLGFLIPAMIIDRLVMEELGSSLWIMGIAVVTFSPVIKRFNIRGKLLREANKGEKTLYNRLYDPPYNSK